MRRLKLLSVSILLIAGFFNFSIAQNIVITQSKESGIYNKGELIEVTALLKDLASDSVTLITRKNFNIQAKKVKLKYSGEKLELFNGSFKEPTSMVFEVHANGEFASTGLVSDPGNFQTGTLRPKDFDKFWKQEKKALRSLLMDVKAKPVENTEEGFECSDIEINCTGPKPARGYFALPKSSKPKSLPIVLIVHAAGVKGSWCLSRPETAVNFAKKGKGTLAFDLNAHGMLNGQPQEYYDELEKGELKGYYYQGMESREEYYFRGMYLRLIRTLDFLCSQPEWDGERIIVIGESQGGGQALAAAGLDKRVSAAIATVPAMCDWGGPEAGKKAGWPQPFSHKGDEQKMLKTLPYFDVAHLLKNSEATLITEIGFVDYTCPSNSIYAAVNQSKGKKITFGVPYRGHHLDQKQFQKTWEETVYHPKMKFIEEFLK